MSSLAQNPPKQTFNRSTEDRRLQDHGSPVGVERRSIADRRTENNIEFVTFYLGDHLLGIPVNLVQEVVPLQKVTSVPRVGAEIRGLMNLRGQIVTVVNIRHKLGFESSHEATRMNVIVNHHGELLSLEVDAVGDVLPVAKSRLLSPPPTLDGLWKDSCENVVQLEKGLLLIVSTEKLFGIYPSEQKGEN